MKVQKNNPEADAPAHSENTWYRDGSLLYILSEEKSSAANKRTLQNKQTIRIEGSQFSSHKEDEALVERIHGFLSATPAQRLEAFGEELIPRKLYDDACRHVSLQFNRANAAEEAFAALRSAQPQAAGVAAEPTFLKYLFDWLEDEATKELSKDETREWRAGEMNGQFDDTFDAGEAHGRGNLAATLRTAIAAERLKHLAAEPSPWRDPNHGPTSAWEEGQQILTEVIVAREGWPHASTAYYCDVNERWFVWDKDGQKDIDDVVGWQPFPALPTAPHQKGGSE